MKTLLILTILTLTTFGCSNKQTPKVEKLAVTETQKKADTIFRQVADFPTIKDTVKFITELRQIFRLEVDESSSQKENEKITTYKKVKIYGSNKDFIFIEYDYKEGCGAAFPWKFQLLLTSKGKLVKTLNGQRFEFIEIFKNKNPFFLIITGTSKGNGGHNIYKISADTLEDVYEGYGFKTYDAHGDNKIYEPYELKLKVNDFNKDSYNDISFYGKIAFIRGQTENGDWFDSETITEKNPFKKIPIEFIFLYDKQSGHFKEKENYKEKYVLDDL